MFEVLWDAGIAGSIATSVESVIVVDPRVANWRALTADAPEGAKVFVLDAESDGLAQVAAIAHGMTGLGSIHILSHGVPGALQIGRWMVDLDALEQASGALRAVGAALKPGGDLLLYGCDVGQGAEGGAFVARLAALTGANVAASSGKVGASGLGGGWTLDVASARIATPVVFSAAARQAYRGLLAASFTFVADPIGQINAGSGEGRMVYGDFDNDGDVDILFQSSNVAGAGFGYFRNNGSGTFTRFNNINSDATGTPFVGFNFGGQQLTGLLTFDVDNDGDTDILDRDPAGGLGFWRNNNGTFSLVADPLGQINAGTAEGRMIAGDFDSDGDVDILFQAGAVLGTAFGYFRNDGAGSFTKFANANDAATPFAGFSFAGQQMSPTALFVIDIDNDGDADILDRNNTSGDTSLSLWRNDNGAFTNQADPLGQINAGTAEGRMVAGDFDSDGDVDILFQAGAVAGTGFGYFRNDGSGSFTKFTNANDAATPFAGFSFAGQQLTSLAVIDYDNDGDIDILDRDYSGNGAGVWSQSGTGNGAPPQLVASTPADNAGAVAVNANIVLTFNEAVTGGAGLIQIHRTSDGVVVASMAGNSAQVSGSGTSTITINPASDLAGSTGYYVTFQEKAFVDSDGMTFGVLEGVERNAITSPTFLNFTTAAVNTPPVLGNILNDVAAYTEGTPALLDQLANLTLTDDGLITGATIEFVDDDIAGDVLSATDQGGVTSSYANGVLTLSGTASAAVYQAVLRSVTFDHTSDDPTAGETDQTRLFSWTVTDDAAQQATSTSLVSLTAVDDAGVAQDDAFTTNEATTLTLGNVLLNNGSGADTDPDSTLMVTAVNGVGASVGNQITLASGALLRLNVNGSFIYNPNGAFNDLPGPASGAVNLTRQDSFSYTLAGGDTATVTVTVSGLDSNGDSLVGDASANTLQGGIGADQMTGLAGNDIYRVDNIGDVADESVAGSNGVDRVFSSISFSLVTVAGVTQAKGFIEGVVLIGAADTYAYGNAAPNTLVGSTGSNLLAAGAGNDILAGRGGNDFFLFNTALNATTNVDTITDMNEDGDDTIQLENAVFRTLSPGALRADFFCISTTGALDANDQIIYNDVTGELFYDANGNAGGGSTLFARLDTGLALTAADFAVV